MHLADQFTSLLENHPEYVLIFCHSHHAGHDVSSLPNAIQSVVDHNCTKVNGQTSASYNHMTQPANETDSSSLMVEAEVIQPSLPHTVQTTMTVEIEEC